MESLLKFCDIFIIAWGWPKYQTSKGNFLLKNVPERQAKDFLKQAYELAFFFFVLWAFPVGPRKIIQKKYKQLEEDTKNTKYIGYYNRWIIAAERKNI